MKLGPAFLKQWTPVGEGLLALIVSISLVSLTGAKLKSTPGPRRWSTLDVLVNRDSGEQRGMYLAVVAIAFVVSICGRAPRSRLSAKYIVGLVVTIVAAMLGQAVARAAFSDESGLSFELWVLIMGMLIGNLWPRVPTRSGSPLDVESKEGGTPTPRVPQTPAPGADYRAVYRAPWLHEALADAGEAGGEFYISIGLVLLAIKVQELAGIGLRGMLLTWAIAPLVVIGGYYILTRCMRMDASFAVLLSCATCICGTSAAMAIREAIGGGRHVRSATTIVIAIVTLFATLQVFVLPSASTLLGMSKRVGGAWIGATQDSTGFVVACASLLNDDEAVTTAATVKMIQNVLIAPVSVVVAAVFATQASGVRLPDHSTERQPDVELAKVNAGSKSEESRVPVTPTSNSTSKVSPPPLHWRSIVAQLWERMPKFIFGFVAVSAALSVMTSVDSAFGDTVHHLVKSLSRIWFAMGFFHIGLSTDSRRLWHDLGKFGSEQSEGPTPTNSQVEATASRSKVFGAYWVVQLIDLVLKGGAAYLIFGVMD